MPIIMLIDMDYFFAACEELRHPEIKDKPVIVGADPKEGKGRGVVSTCNYIARRYGIHSGMPISMAYRLNKDAVYLPVDFEFYESVSREVMDILKRFAGKFEQVSVDEAFIDVTDKVADLAESEAYAGRIKKEVADKLRLPCSIGVSVNKLIAKMACEAAKPSGIKVIRQEEILPFLKDMPIGKLYGIGGKTREKLESMGFRTAGELSKANPMDLIKAFGVFGTEIYRYSKGIDDSRVEENFEVKSIGRESTFDQDTTDRSEILDMIDELSKQVVKEIEAGGFGFKTVTLKIRYEDFDEHLKSKSLNYYSNNIADIKNTAARLYDDFVDKSRRIRKLGVRVSSLIDYRGQRKLNAYVT